MYKAPLGPLRRGQPDRRRYRARSLSPCWRALTAARWPGDPAALMFCLPTLYPDLGRGTDEHLVTALAAAARAGCASLDVFGSHVIQAIESAAAGGVREALTPSASRRDAIGAFRAAVRRWPDALARPEAATVRGEFTARGLRVLAVECLSMWPDGDGPDAEADAEAVCQVAAFLGAAYVVAVCLQPEMEPAAGASGLRTAAAVAARHGLRVCLEWLPGTGMPSMGAARELIERSGAGNVGYTLDVLHWQCQPGGPDWNTLAEVDPESVYVVQLSDCALPLAPGMAEPSVRLLPGAGDIDAAGLLRRVAELGMRPVMSAEVFDEGALMVLGPDEFARRQVAALHAVLRRV
jgi:sugar phosphate isomerase/epimerase